MRTRLILALILAFHGAGAIAGPAPWYLWRSNVDGKTFCLQTSPGEGWTQVAGPFKDARCTQRV